MTKEDKQIIDRAVKEEWRIGDRTRLKHLLEKNLEQYRENVELEKVCQDLSDKFDYQVKQVMKLEEENNKLLDVINGQDVKIADLEKENAELRRDKEDLIFVRNAKADHINELKDQLTKATKLLNEFMRISKASDEDFEHDYSELIGETEQFIKEIEK